MSIGALPLSTALPITSHEIFADLPPAALATADSQLPCNIKVVATRVLQTIFPSPLSNLILDYLITPLSSQQDIYGQMYEIRCSRQVLADWFFLLVYSGGGTTTAAINTTENLVTLITSYCIIDIEDIYIQAGILDQYSFRYVPKPLKSSTLSPGQKEFQIRLDKNDIASRYIREFLHAYKAMLNERFHISYKWHDARDAAFSDSEDDPRRLGFAYKQPSEMQIGKYTVGIAEARGRRLEMLDYHLCVELHFNTHNREYRIPFFGIFDGHGGIAAAEFAYQHFTDILIRTLEVYNPEKFDLDGMYNALKMSGVRLNIWFCNKNSSKKFPNGEHPGTTLLFVIEVNGIMYCVSIGDSRAVLYNEGMFIPLTEDAKPTNERFAQGIKNRGGCVRYGRLGGQLDMTRAIGNMELGKQLSARPKITMLPLSFISPGALLLMFTDGIYETVSTQQLLEVIEKHCKESPVELAKSIVYSAYQCGSKDNLTVLVIRC